MVEPSPHDPLRTAAHLPDAAQDGARAEEPPSPPPRTDNTGGASDTTGNSPKASRLISVPGYAIEGELGRGGMGVVYKARQLKLNRTVALKTVLGTGTLDRKELIRFLAEAEAVAAIRHPHVVQVYEYGEAANQPYMALELLPGGTLTDRLKSMSKRDPVILVTLLGKVARGVAAAHAAGIVHRDLKPHNVLFDTAGEPKVTDFGLAKLTFGEELTRTGSIMGTPAFMAPEQASGNTKFVGPQADVWALGVMLYESLSGQRPFRHRDADVLLAMIRSEEAPSLRSHSSNLPRDLDVICRKCLEKSPTDRYPTAAELADDLERFARGEPITARPAGFVERTFKWAKRKPTLAALYAAVSVAVLALVVGGAVAMLWRKSVRAEGEATSAKLEAVQERDRALVAEGNATDARKEAERQKGFAEEERDNASQAEKRALAAEAKALWLEHARAVDLAHREWEKKNFVRARMLLDACRPELRGWEWHYVHRICNADTATVKHCFATRAVSPDGSRAVGLGMKEGQIRIWSIPDGAPVLFFKPLPGERLMPRMAFSHDNLLLATVYSSTGRVFITDAVPPTDGRVNTTVRFVGMHDQVSAVAFSRDRRQLVTGGSDKLGRVWDLTAEKPTAVELKGHMGRIEEVAFSPDGQRVVTASEDGSAKVWDAKTGELITTCKGHEGVVWTASFDPDGNRVLTGSSDRTACVWEAKTGKLLRKFDAHSGGVRSAGFDPAGKRIATGGEDAVVFIWDAEGGGLIEGLSTLVDDSDQTVALSFSPNGKRLITGTLHHGVQVWDLPTNSTGFVVVSRDVPFASLGFSSTGREFFTTEGTTVGSWNAETGEWVGEVIPEGTARAWSMVSPAGCRALSVHPNGTATVWDTGTRARIATLKGCPPSAVWAFAPDGSKAVSRDRNLALTIWDTTTGDILTTIPALAKLPGGPVGFTRDGPFPLVFSRDGTLLASAWINGEVRVWDTKTGTAVSTLNSSDVPEPRGDTISSVTFSPDGTRLLIGYIDLVVRDVKTGAVQSRFSVNWTTRASFSPDGTRLVVGNRTGEVKMFDAKSGIELLTFNGHTDGVTAIVFSPDGRRFATVARDRTVRMWDSTPINREFRPWEEAPLPRVKQ